MPAMRVRVGDSVVGIFNMEKRLKIFPWVLEPVDGMAMSNLVISANSASEYEVKSDSLIDFDPESEDSEEEVNCSKGIE